MRTIIALLALGALASCGDATQAINSDATPATLQVQTAKFWKTSPGNVRISNMRQGVTGTKYIAKVGRATYECHYIRGAITCDVPRSAKPKRDVWAL